MKQWKKAEKVNFDKIREQVSKCYGIEHPERIQGYAGFFCNSGYDIWIDEDIEVLLGQHPDFEREITTVLQRFYKDDYGEADKDRVDLNGENKYFFGCWGIIGIYMTSFGCIMVNNNDKSKIDITAVKSC